MKILVVDDEPVSRLIAQAALTSLGHEPVLAEGGEAGWEMFLKERPDVVISDWMMPDLDGIKLSRRIRASEHNSYTSIIVLTSLDDKKRVREAILAGADDYLTKPLNPDELGIRLIAAARLRELHDQLAAQQQKLEALNEELGRTARIDPLTGLGNRLRMREDLAGAISRMRRYGTTCCIGLIDLDSFKAYNDTYGHLMGDRALKAVARVISSRIRGGDGAYRYGGEELVCLLPEQSLEEAAVVMERIRQGVQDLALVHAGNPPAQVVTVSAGVCRVVAGDPGKPERILEEADRALYRAKANGRNRVEVAGSESAA
ncbi:MAG: diguanylate cyclase [Actinomycetota bacterium]